MCVYKISDETFTPLFVIFSRDLYIYVLTFLSKKSTYFWCVCVCVGKKRTKYVMFIINRAKSISYVQIYVFFSFGLIFSSYIYKNINSLTVCVCFGRWWYFWSIYIFLICFLSFYIDNFVGSSQKKLFKKIIERGWWCGGGVIIIRNGMTEKRPYVL